MRAAQPISRSGAGPEASCLCHMVPRWLCLVEKPLVWEDWLKPSLVDGVFPTLRFIFSAALINSIPSGHMLIFLWTSSI